MTVSQIIVLCVLSALEFWVFLDMAVQFSIKRRVLSLIHIACLMMFVAVYILFCLEHNSTLAKASRAVDKVEKYKPILDTLYKKVTDGRKN